MRTWLRFNVLPILTLALAAGLLAAGCGDGGGSSQGDAAASGSADGAGAGAHPDAGGTASDAGGEADAGPSTSGDATPAPSGDAGNPSGASLLTTPYDVTLTDDYAVVCDANLDANFKPGKGWLVVLDRKTLEEVNRIALPDGANAQYLAQRDGTIVVSMSGSSTYDPDTGLSSPTGPSWIGAVAASSLATATQLDVLVELPLADGDPLAGAAGHIAVASDGKTVFAGSGTAPHVYVVDIAQGTVLRGPSNPIVVGEPDDANHLVTLGWDQDGRLLAADFNAALVYRIDPSTFDVLDAPLPTASSPDTFAGPVMPYGLGDGIVVFNTGAGEVVKLGPDGSIAPLAAVPDFGNRLLVVGGRAWASFGFGDGSPSDGVVAFALDGSAAGILGLDGKNPMGMAFDEATGELFVALEAARGLGVFDANDGLSTLRSTP